MNSDEYYAQIIQRLKQNKYHIWNNTTYENQNYKYVAKRTKFEIERFSFCTTFFLFAEFDTLDFSTLEEYSAKSFKYSLKLSGIHPLRVILYNLLTIPVALVNSIDDRTVRLVRKQEPPRHWKAFEKMVVFSLESKTLYYCENTYSWGYIYYELDRNMIRELLSP
jgi:hypothetical protein